MQVVLRSALDTTLYRNHSRSPVVQGLERRKNYQRGAAAFFALAGNVWDHHVLVVDNTLGDSSKLREVYQDVLPESTDFIASATNKYGKHNKGAGDYETIHRLIKGGLLHSDFLFIELRLRIRATDFIDEFLSAPRSLASFEKDESLKSGYYGLSAEAARLFFNNPLKPLAMTVTRASIENDMAEFWRRHSLEIWRGDPQFLRNDPVLGWHQY